MLKTFFALNYFKTCSRIFLPLFRADFFSSVRGFPTSCTTFKRLSGARSPQPCPTLPCQLFGEQATCTGTYPEPRLFLQRLTPRELKPICPAAEYQPCWLTHRAFWENGTLQRCRTPTMHSEQDTSKPRAPTKGVACTQMLPRAQINPRGPQ